MDSYGIIWQTSDNGSMPKGFSKAPAAPASFSRLVPSAVTRRQTSASFSPHLHHSSAFIPSYSLSYVKTMKPSSFTICVHHVFSCAFFSTALVFEEH